ncbi:MAG: hypothetical protein IKB07_09065 [Lachnospiraceae bacterium]|nr:hypothetical protein [Lachnospiraceae bacterium]
MNEQEKEINLKRLFYKACKNWRIAVVAAFIGAAVIGGTKCTVEFVKVHDPEVVAERQTEYEGELALYQQRGEVIRKSMDSLQTSMQQQKEYNEKSVLMKIDPYNEWRGSVDFYVETDWQIMPELTYQNQNPANQIVRVYSTYITNGELYQYVIDRLDAPMEIRYLREILEGTVDTANFLIHFSVRGVSEAECQNLLRLVEEGMRAKQTEIEASVGTYKLLTTNSAVYSQINYELEQMQKDNQQEVSDLNTALTAKKFEQLEWERDKVEIESPIIGRRAAVKAGIKVAIITGLVIGFLILAFYGVGYLLSKLVQDKDEFQGWEVYVAELPRTYKKKPFAWVDRLIGRWFLGNVEAGEYETRLSAATKQIGEAAKLSFDTTEPKLTLVGDLPAEELAALAEEMGKEKGARRVQFSVAGNPVLSAGAIDSILFADGVVLVAKQEYSKRETVYQIKAQVEELKKPLVAVVLTEVDAMV